MLDQAKPEVLYRRLFDERRKAVTAAANVDALPPFSHLTYLAALDGTIAALESVLSEAASAQAVR